MKRNILSLTPSELEEIIVNRYHEQPYRAIQVFEWLYKPIESFDEMQNIPKGIREKLIEDFYLGIPEIVKTLISKDGSQKFLMRFHDDQIIESVLIPYHYGDSMCISTQVGCKMSCSFCASGRMGFVRNLEAGEIIGQILRIQRITGRRVSSVSLMGVGEPLDNYENVIKFLKIIHHPKGENLGYRNISISTVGIAPKILELANLNLPIQLCVSLHFPTDELRSEIMPINGHYPINDLIDSLKAYAQKIDHQISIEYILIKHLNDSPQHAEQLIKILKDIYCHVTLLPINETSKDMEPPDRKTVKRFKDLLNKAGLRVTIRRRAGNDIDAACGQLRRWSLEECTDSNSNSPQK